MTASFEGFEAVTASTDDPLGMLAACHGRVRKQCATLRALLPHLKSHGADDQAASAAHRVMRYFDEAALHHHADEQEDLFPQLAASAMGEREIQTVRELCGRLTSEHLAMGELWQQLRGHLIQARSHQIPDLLALTPLVQQFTKAYETHTAFEDERLLPLASKLLSTDALQRLGNSMKKRRLLA